MSAFVCLFLTLCASMLRCLLCPTLCDPMGYSPSDSSAHGILQARTLEWVAIPSSRGSSQLRDRTHISYVSALAGGFFTTRSLLLAGVFHKCQLSESEVTQLCLTLCYPVEYSPPGSSVHRIFWARILEWVAISFSRVSSQPRDWTSSPALQADALTSELPGSSCYFGYWFSTGLIYQLQTVGH